MPLGHLYSCFNFLAYGYAISGYPTHNGDEIAIQKIYRSFIREITKTIWIFYRIMHAASCTIFAWESITPVTTESTVPDILLDFNGLDHIERAEDFPKIMFFVRVHTVKKYSPSE